MQALHLYTRPDLLLQVHRDLGETLQALARSGAALAIAPTEHRLLDDLVDEAWARDLARRPARLGPAGEALALALVAAEAEGPLSALAEPGPAPALGQGLLRSLYGVFQTAGVAGVSPSLFERLAARLAAGQPAARVTEIARLYGRYRTLLGPQLADEGMAWRRGVLQLARGVPGLPPDQALLVTVHGLERCPEAAGAVPTRYGRLAALQALATADPEALLPFRRRGEAVHAPPLDAAGGAEAPLPLPGAPVAPLGRRRAVVRVVLPAVEGRPLLEAALSPLLEGLYRYHEADLEEVRVPLGPALAQPDQPFARFVGGLFLPSTAAPLLQPGELPSDLLELCAAPSPSTEARGVARRVRDLLDAGVAPAAIAVVAQGTGARARIAAALRRYGVAVHHTPPPPGLPPEGSASVASAPPIQVLLGLYDLLERGVPREGLLQHLSSSYLRWGHEAVPAWRVARALREAGVRDLRPAAELRRQAQAGSGEADHRRRLREWTRQRLAERRDAGPGESGVIAALEGALGLLDGLPAQGPLAAHTGALLRFCERVHLAERASGMRGAPGPVTADADLADLDEGAALSRDQEAVAVLLQLLEDWPGAARRLGRAAERISRQRFARLLLMALSRARLRPRGAGEAVLLGDLQALCGRRFGHLFIAGLVDGELPAPTAEDPLLGDEERRGLNRLLGQEVFPPIQGADVLQPLWFAQVLAHSQAAHLSWPVSDEDGRPLMRSPYVDEVLRAGALPEPPRERHAAIPATEEARCPAELWARAGLDLRPAGRRPRDQVVLQALAQQDPGRARRLADVIRVEEERLRWFAALAAAGEGEPRVPPGPFVGRLLDPALRQQISGRLPGAQSHPLSASALEDYAKCPFRFFVRRVLKAEPLQEGGDDLDPLAGGRLHHAVLEQFFKERLAAGRLPLRGDGDDTQALDRAMEEVLGAWPQRERTGHEELFQVRVRRLREDLRYLIDREARHPIDPGCVPHLFEHRFGPLAITSPSERDGGMPLHIFGIIDRVDVGPGRAVVLDYKAGRLDRYEKILKKDLLTTSFQLPLYAAALKADPKLADLGISGAEVTARYYSLRNGRASAGQLADQQMISLLPEVQEQAPERNVAEVAYRLWRRLRDGDFRVAPRTCEGCGLEGACRVTLVAQFPEEESEGEQRPGGGTA